jgi:hypothetical protein
MSLCFFTDPAVLPPQAEQDAFGPVVGAPTQYRVCSRHSTAGPAAVHAVCDGILMAQRLDDQHVNLVLKPLRHQFGSLPPVHCFVYRRVLRDSLITGPQIAAETTNDLTSAIWAAHAALVQSVTDATGTAPTTTPGPELLGLESGDALSGDLTVADMILHPPPGAAFPLVRRGWRIGLFAQNNFAFQVVLESIDGRITLNDVRSTDHIVDVPALSTDAGDVDILAHWQAKLEVLNYMDPAAFFGSAGTAQVSVPTAGGLEVWDDAQFGSALLNRFHNSGVVYLDVRDEHETHLRQVGDYGAGLRITAAGSTAVIDATRSGWPIVKLTADDFPGLDTGDTSASLHVAFPVGENAIPVAFIGHGATVNSFPHDVAGYHRFVELSPVDTFTSPVRLMVGVREGSPACGYVRLTYARGFDWAAFPRSSHDRVLFDNHVIDNLFRPFAMAGDLGTPYVRIHHQPRYVDDPHTHDSDLVMSVGTAVDGQYVTFFAYPTLRNVELDDEPGNIPLTEHGALSEPFLKQLGNQGQRFTLVKREFSAIDGTGQSVLQLEALDDGPRFLSADWRDFYAVVFTHAEFEELRSLRDASNFDPRFPIYLGITDHLSQWDSEGEYFEQCQLVLRGFAMASGQLSVTEVDTGKALLIS